MSLKIAIDFDGTCVKHSFPEVGDSIGAEEVLKKLIDKGHKLILYTMRSDVKNPSTYNKEDKKVIVLQGGNYLTQAVNWFKEKGIKLYGIQKDPGQSSWTHSNKCFAHLYIDDAALGISLIYPEDTSEKPYVDWNKVKELLIEREIL